MNPAVLREFVYQSLAQKIKVESLCRSLQIEVRRQPDDFDCRQVSCAVERSRQSDLKTAGSDVMHGDQIKVVYVFVLKIHA